MALAEAALPEESTDSTRKVCVPGVVSTGVALQLTREPSTSSWQKYDGVIVSPTWYWAPSAGERIVICGGVRSTIR